MIILKGGGTVEMRRFACAVQYHGGYFLGFARQPNQEDQIVDLETTAHSSASTRLYTNRNTRNNQKQRPIDHRGLLSVEGKLQKGVRRLLGQIEEDLPIQVSSRTDRGVHALYNTFHIDLPFSSSNLFHSSPQTLCGAWNYHLQQLHNDCHATDYPYQSYQPHNLTLLNCCLPPTTSDNNSIPWNARYTATHRTYLYRILVLPPGQQHPDYRQYPLLFGHGHDTIYILRMVENQQNSSLDVDAMQQAAQRLVGTHDYSAFRNAGCQRKSPITTLESIQVRAQPSYCDPFSFFGQTGSMLAIDRESGSQLVVTILVKGKSFLYRQVRNMVGCLLEVGIGKLKPIDVSEILESRNRSEAPYSTAPAHGLFLVDVQHENGFHI